MSVAGRSDLRHLTPDSIRAPFARYSHGVEVAPGTRLLFCSGQLGIAKDESVPEDVEAQTLLALQNSEAILKEAGMDRRDVIRLNSYVTGREHLAGYMKARDAFFAEVDPPPASTLMIVSGFAREIFKVEIEIVAGKEDVR